MRTLKTGLLVALLAVVLAACGGNDDSTPAGDTTTTGGVELPQSITSTDDAGGVLTVDYPAGWIAQEFGGSVSIGNDQAVFTSDAQQLNAGQVIGTLLALPSEMLGLLGLGDNPSVTDVLANFMNTTLTEDPEAQFTVGEVDTFTVNGRPAAMQTGTGTDASGTNDVAFVMVEAGAGFVLVSFIAPQGEIANYDAQIRAIAGSAEYIVPEAEG